jgi:hypothetical protein
MSLDAGLARGLRPIQGISIPWQKDVRRASTSLTKEKTTEREAVTTGEQLVAWEVLVTQNVQLF